MIDMNLPFSLPKHHEQALRGTGYHGKHPSPDGGRPRTKKMKGSVNSATVEATRPGTKTKKIKGGRSSISTKPSSSRNKSKPISAAASVAKVAGGSILCDYCKGYISYMYI